MSLASKGAGSREADPRNAVLTGRSVRNSETERKVYPSIAAEHRRAVHLRARFGLSEALSRVVAGHAFGDTDNGGDCWIALGEAAARAIDASAKAMEARS